MDLVVRAKGTDTSLDATTRKANTVATLSENININSIRLEPTAIHHLTISLQTKAHTAYHTRAEANQRACRTRPTRPTAKVRAVTLFHMVASEHTCICGKTISPGSRLNHRCVSFISVRRRTSRSSSAAPSYARRCGPTESSPAGDVEIKVQRLGSPGSVRDGARLTLGASARASTKPESMKKSGICEDPTRFHCRVE